VKTNPPSRDHPNVIAFPPGLLLGSAVVSAALGVWVPMTIANYRWCWPLGAVLALTAGGLAKWAEHVMRTGGTNIIPNQPALVIVRDGPFRFTRNPMYLSLCLLQASLGLFMNNWLTLGFTAVLGAVLHFGVILREERYLAAKFGEPYLDLKRRVRRWI
jgi:protein-S-isoprenylcysteine O-methyltransferase Ste14